VAVPIANLALVTIAEVPIANLVLATTALALSLNREQVITAAVLIIKITTVITVEAHTLKQGLFILVVLSLVLLTVMGARYLMGQSILQRAQCGMCDTTGLEVITTLLVVRTNSMVHTTAV
jgi:hypothetical protein